MATISVSTISNGTTADASDVNTNFNTIVNEINGNIDDANIKAQGVNSAAIKQEATASWTPTINGTGGVIGTFAYDSGSFTYIQYGKMTYVQGHGRITNVGSWSGTFRISLPVAPKPPALGDLPLTGWLCAQSTNPATGSKGLPVIPTNQTTVQFINSENISALNWSGVGANDCFRFSGWYEAA